MTCRNMIQNLTDSRATEDILRRGSEAKEAISALQKLLRELGFGTELKWDRYGADGSYGNCTVTAVSTFAAKNGLSGDGESVTQEIAEMLLVRYDTLDEMQHLHNVFEENKDLLYRSSRHSQAVAALQTLLNELGFGTQLRWDKHRADGDYGSGTARAVRAFAKQEGVASDGESVSMELIGKIIDGLKGHYGRHWSENVQETVAEPLGLTTRQTVEGGRTRVYVSDGTTEARFTRYKRGVYVVGDQRPAEVIASRRSEFVRDGLTDSAVNVMVSVSRNEGNLDAINTWDNAFFTFGMFQWTIGVGRDAGELAVLLRKIEEADPEVFYQHYGRHGLGLVNTNRVSGRLSLGGKTLMTAEDKESIRTLSWAYHFWCSGHDPVVQSVQVKHAFSRLKRFYDNDRVRVKGHRIADLVSSEYGVTLLLDNHVNRPAYVKPCLEKAIDKTGLTNPESWGTDEETQLLGAYLEIRETYGRSPMTDAARRAEVTKVSVRAGEISDERGTFEYGV